MESLIRFFATRKTVANVFTLFVLILGAASVSVIQRDSFPAVDFKQLNITTRYPGASPEDVELNVTNKIEEALKSVDGLRTVESVSMENVSVVSVRLDPDVGDVQRVKSKVYDAVSRVSELPTEVDEDPVVEEVTTSTAAPVIEVGVSGNVPYTQLREFTKRVERGLRDLPGVAKVTDYGFRDREIKVEIDQGALDKWKVSAQQVVDAIRQRNIRASGGSFESYTSEKKIVTLAQFEDPLEANEVIVDVTEDGTLIRVKDLAVLKDDFVPAKVLSRMNGTRAITLRVFKKPRSDLLRTIAGIKTFVDNYQMLLPKGVEIAYANDTSRLVSNRLAVVATNGVVGLALVLLVLSLTLNARLAFWVALGIPVALAGTVFLLPLFGAYLDSLALGAMILVIGIIVDDGIIVGENIWRYRELGYEATDAAVNGTVSVFKPVLTTILTTALAFAPMFFMPGMMGDFVFVIPLVVICALAVSFLEVTFALPAHISSGLVNSRNVSGRGERYFAGMRERLGEWVHMALDYRYLVVGTFLLVLGLTAAYAILKMDFVLFPSPSAERFFIFVELPSGSSLEATEDKIEQVEGIVSRLPASELDSFVTRVGMHGGLQRGESENWAYMEIHLTPLAIRARDADQIVAGVREQVAQINGIERVVFRVDSGGPPVGWPVEIQVVGSDDEKRQRLADLLVRRLQGTEGISDVDRSDRTGKEQVKIDFDYVRLADNGLTVADVARNVRLAYDGEVVTSVRYGDEDVEFRVILEESARKTTQALANLLIEDPNGRFVRLQEVGEFTPAVGPSSIYHFDNERTTTVTADLDKQVITPLQATAAALAYIDLEKDWAGVRLLTGGETQETSESIRGLVITYIVALVAIYLLLVLLFDSMLLPALVMLVIPFGLIGVIVGFALHGEALGMLAMLGAVGLAGILVNDSLILVNTVNALRREQPADPPREAIVEGVKARTRPILLTSITTIAGLLPMAYGLGGTDAFSAPMALALGYGILFATPLTLILLPCLLLVRDDLGLLVDRYRRAGRA